MWSYIEWNEYSNNLVLRQYVGEDSQGFGENFIDMYAML